MADSIISQENGKQFSVTAAKIHVKDCCGHWSNEST